MVLDPTSYSSMTVNMQQLLHTISSTTTCPSLIRSRVNFVAMRFNRTSNFSSHFSKNEVRQNSVRTTIISNLAKISTSSTSRIGTKGSLDLELPTSAIMMILISSISTLTFSNHRITPLLVVIDSHRRRGARKRASLKKPTFQNDLCKILATITPS